MSSRPSFSKNTSSLRVKGWKALPNLLRTRRAHPSEIERVEDDDQVGLAERVVAQRIGGSVTQRHPAPQPNNIVAMKK